MTAPLDDVCCARLPAAALAWLAPLRVRPGVRVRADGACVWLWWTAGDEPVLRRVLALHGAELFARREGHWYRPGHHVPAFEVPAEDGAVPLLQALTPAPVHPDSGGPSFAPLPVSVVRDDRPRPASALACSLDDLAAWAENATSRQLAAVEGICTEDCVLLRGEHMPPLAEGRRYWGRVILTPLGFRPEPELSEGVLIEALGLGTHEIALWDDTGFEILDARLFRPLTRAGVRLAGEGR